jgi:hypothetical protein
VNIVGKDGFRVPGLDLPEGTLVKLLTVKLLTVTHSEKPLPPHLWDEALAESPERPFRCKFVTRDRTQGKLSG